MLYFVVDSKANLIKVTDAMLDRTPHTLCRWDFLTLIDAEVMAVSATSLTSKLHIATDAGPHCHPRFDVIEAPKVGDGVSQSFNGDTYPRGTIVTISKTLKKVVTDDGTVFWRCGNTGSWLAQGYASMISGHVSEMNPSF